MKPEYMMWVVVALSVVASGALAADKPVIHIPTITEAELPKLERKCEEETKNNSFGNTYRLVTGTQVFSNVLVPPTCMPTGLSTSCKSKIKYTYEMHIEGSLGLLYKIYFPIDTYVDTGTGIISSNGFQYAICAAKNPSNGLYGGALETLALIHGLGGGVVVPR